MSNLDQTQPRRGRAPIRRNVGQGSSGGRGDAPVPGQEPRPPAPHPAGRGITSEIPHGVQFGVGGGGSGTVDPSVGGGSGGESAAVLRIGGVFGSGSGGVVQRKRTREGDDGAGPSRPVRDVPPPPLPPPPPPPAGAVVEGQGMFYCSICDRYFDSDRGLCGHLRTHADRGYRGAFPPPTFTQQEFVDEGVEHLLNPLDGGDVASQGGEAVEPPAAAGGGVEAPVGPNVEERAEGAAEASGEAERRRNLDLNASPPRDESGDFI